MNILAPTPEEVIKHLIQDPVFRPIINSVEYPEFNGGGSVYESLLNSIISQQLSVKAASTIYSRFLNLFDGMSPIPEALLATPVEVLRSVGISRQKSTYLLSVADHFKSVNEDASYWSSHTDEEVINELVQIKGVGRWTVQMVLMFTLDRPDVFPVDDLGIRKGMEKVYGLSADDYSRKDFYQQLEAIAENWSPYRTIACKYIWKYFE